MEFKRPKNIQYTENQKKKKKIDGDYIADLAELKILQKEDIKILSGMILTW